MLSYEQREAQANHVRDHVLPFVAHELSQLDGRKWTYEPAAERGWIAGRFHSGEESFSVGTQDGKLTIYSRYGTLLDGRQFSPRDYQRGDSAIADPQPSMAATKTDKQIAADIVRRFLPDYRKLLDLYRQVVQQQSTYRSNVDNLAQQLHTASHGLINAHRPQHSSDAGRTAHLSECESVGLSYGTVKVYDSDVRLELSVSPTLAVKIAKLLAEK